MRNDLEDADDEELEDRLIEAAHIAQRPLHMDEVRRMSRKKGLEGQNFNDSILSGVLSHNDILKLNRESNILRSSGQFGS